MTLQQLKYIVAIDRYRNFAKAADACGISQPTLSAMLVKLEEELNRLNAAYHFVEPVYITDWLKDCLFDQIDGEINPKYLRKGVFHLMMERGMGKTSYAFSLDSQNDGHSSVDLRDTVVRVFYCNRVQLRSAQEFADGTGMCMEGWPERAIDWFEGLPG